ncbi:MAG: MBL fold metallo-hydrolase [Acidobacteriota bacterium]|nr:MBL fold metallo-hydrolase [Acidobacteriota bacterium]
MRFRNPPGSPPQIAGPADFAPFFLRRALDRPPAVPAGHVIPLAEAKAMLAAAGPESLSWLGHACFLIRTGGFSILTDPFLSDYASPVAGLGPRRYVPPGISLEGLPKIDAIVISHNHYDHLDDRSVREISLKGRGKVAAVVPSGLGSFFSSRGYSDVRELGWGDRTLLRNLKFSCLPCIHFSGRTPFDSNRSLWASWSIVSPSLSLFFAGDTGYGPVFAETGRQYGPFDLALVPIGAYEPSSIMRPVHCDPEEAVALGRDVRASTLVAMHWGTIVLTDEPPFEPPGRFRAAANRAGYPDDRAWVLKIGETRATPRA